MRSLRYTASLLMCASAVIAADPGMVFIPGGVYLRGRSHPLPDDDLKWQPTLVKDDRPVKPVHIQPFYLDQREVTNREYDDFVRATRRKPPPHWPKGLVPEGKDQQPVANVSWLDASAYAAWKGKRLPTEAEWERACRGMAEGAIYPWGDQKPTPAMARFNSVDGPAETGRCQANAFGLYDMAGNVWEWCADWYEREHYSKAPAYDPQGPAEGMYRVLRGGSWADVEKYLSCSYRSWARPKELSPNIGFRCARDFATGGQPGRAKDIRSAGRRNP